MNKETTQVAGTYVAPRDGFVRVAIGVPRLKVADVGFNVTEITSLAREAAAQGAALVCFPELCLTSYTAGDLFHDSTLLEAARAGLARLATELADINTAVVVGLPLVIGTARYNVAAVIAKGRVLGFVPKTSVPGYKEFYEERWFAASHDLRASTVEFCGYDVPVGIDLLFAFDDARATLAIDICEDLWTPLPPSSFSTVAGATIIANLSASNELVGKAKYRRDLVVGQSARTVSAYAYVSAGVDESTTDVVFGGHGIIADNGAVLAETERYARKSQLSIADVDVDALMLDRAKTTSFGESVRVLGDNEYRTVHVPIDPVLPTDASLKRPIASHPFLGANDIERREVADEVFAIQTAGLAKRLEQSGVKKIVLGLSGGLDSTLALLVACKAMDMLDLPRTNIECITMPGFGTTDRTKSNAHVLARTAGTTLREVSIVPGATQALKDIGHDGVTPDITYENAQARYRTLLLMDVANQIGGIVLGTGDLSEIALGWCTFSGDHLSHYNVNAGVPKTLVRHVVERAAELEGTSELGTTLTDVLDTPVSPELKKEEGDAITQKTEDVVGPYELHDFFIYHVVRWSARPSRVLRLAKQAFAGRYDEATIKKWLKAFITRFFRNQWKRSVMPDGPKVGSVALSPRGDWRMPSDAEATEWLNDLDR